MKKKKIAFQRVLVNSLITLDVGAVS